MRKIRGVGKQNINSSTLKKIGYNFGYKSKKEKM
ncbi:hypothetical protein J2W57_002355 [Chryseobacterium ginsenosidimutans]|uniref:Uncharacterized protein n=1 Tax=Chryseobacterium geocarposphaerae TaxID=1416776 RepID=A0ABU1LGK4_9FLAO|nr:hypothetical protein [Chryseobacterium geocarposphaerae]MDR6698978.1 hypothetical protein [Chryseobacterium ginsenosidimutans]